MAGQNYISRIVNEYEGGNAAQQAAKDMQKVEQSAKQVNKAQIRTTQTSQEFIRIIQDAPFGMMGMANNITAVGDSIGYATRQGHAFGTVLKESLKALVTGPMALPLIITLITTVAMNFDKVAAAARTVAYQLGLVNEEAEDFSDATEAGYQNVIKLAVANKSIAELEDDYETAKEAQEDLNEQILTAWFGTENWKRELAETIPFLSTAFKVVDAIGGGLFGMQEAYAKFKATGNFREDLDLVEDLTEGLGEEAAKKKAEERMRELVNSLNIAFREELDNATDALTPMDWVEFQVGLMREGRQKMVQEAHLWRVEMLDELDEFRRQDIIDQTEYLQEKENITRGFNDRITEAYDQEMEDVLGILNEGFDDINLDDLDHSEEMLDRHEYTAKRRVEIKKAETKRLAEEERRQRRESLRTLQVQSNIANSLGMVFGDLATLTAKQNRQAFEENKKMLVGQATMQAIAAGVSTVRTFMASAKGPWDIAAALASGATIVSTLMASVKRIKQTEYGGSTGSMTGSFTSLNPTTTGRRVRNFDRNRQRDQGVTDAVREVGRSMDRLDDRLGKLEVTIDDKTSEQVVNRGMKRRVKLNS